MEPIQVIAMVAAAAVFGGLIGAFAVVKWLSRERRVDPHLEANRKAQRERAAAEKLKELLANSAAIPLSGEVAQLLASGQWAAAIERIEASK